MATNNNPINQVSQFREVLQSNKEVNQFYKDLSNRWTLLAMLGDSNTSGGVDSPDFPLMPRAHIWDQYGHSNVFVASADATMRVLTAGYTGGVTSP